MQCAFVFEKISTFIKKGIKPEKIAVILPDEEFADILRLHDKYNMLNFAMGEKIARTLFYRVLSKINESIKENAFVDFNAVKNEISNEYSLFFLQIGLKESLYERIKINFEQVVEFSEFSEIINEILSLKNENLNEFIAKPLFMIEIFLQKNTLCLKETIELFLILLGDVKIPHIGGGAVSVLGVLESRGMKFDGVIIIDFNDDLVPNRSSGEMFLSSAVRKEAGLISHADRENLQRFYYESLINSAKFVAISYEKSEEKLKSRFLNNFSYKEDNDFSEDDYLQTFGNDQKMVMKNDEPIIKKEDFFKEALSFSRLNCY
ncbi:MAG: PD-(D/E)XK nuclease family protein, partial [Campylobacter sp.]|nr:PD-(D/E)XK nuclease family protein [Campylobacter sp.]